MQTKVMAMALGVERSIAKGVQGRRIRECAAGEGWPVSARENEVDMPREAKERWGR